MIGVTPAGEEVVVDRDGRPAPHPLTHGTPREIRSTFVRSLRAAGRSWEDIAKIQRCSVKSVMTDAKATPLRLHRAGALADAG